MNINATIIGQIIWFLLFLWFVKAVVWPFMNRMIEERQKTIADGLAAAEQGKRALELSSRQAEQDLASARERASEILAQAERRAAQMIEEAKNAAKEEGNREKAAAQAEIEQEVSRAREMLREQVAALAVAGAEKILRREVNPQTHAQLLTELKSQI
ncbi:MAG: F0F1 ATP synthase subunit B [Betaproteobacteria bacterium RBG_16_64_9]|nr:MAG: F0F1 ATP synthase subunit B [Betaproteobacteria bacterium RBG_16_64_9]OGA30383.1 MAG: F0F1 ATP synthase subunit B [Betaproteobacteria bacterium RIFCSPLOWO2_02_FULL_65_24]